MTLPVAVTRATPVLAYSPHPLLPAEGRELILVELFPGETLGGYLERVGVWQRIRNRCVLVTINGVPVQMEWWWRCRPKPGTLINVQAVVHGGGGGGGKNPIATVLSIALLVTAPYLAGYALTGTWAAATGLAGTILTTGIVIVGGLVNNALFPPPRPQLSQAGGAFKNESPTYSLSGGSNRIRPYEPLPVIMGRHRVFPDAGARTYTEFDGEDQYLYQVFDFGYNDVILSEFRIGANPIENYEGVTIQESGADGVLSLFPGNVDTTPGAELTEAAGWIQRTSGADAQRLAVEVVGQLFYVNSSGLALAGVEFGLQYRLEGSADWLQFPLGDATLFYSHYWSAGFYQTIRIDTGEGFTYETSWVQRNYGSNNEADHTDGDVADTESYWDDDGEHTRDIVWRWRPYTEINGDVVGPPLNNNLSEPAPWPGYQVPAATGWITSDARAPIRKTYAVDVVQGTYEVRLQRAGTYYSTNATTRDVRPDQTTDWHLIDEDDENIVAALTWSQLRTYQPDAADYSGRKRVALKIRASGQLNGQVEQFNCIASARALVWNGLNWEVSETSNPGWCVMAAAAGNMTGGRRRWGAGLDSDRVNVTNLMAFAEWCDDNGLTFNAVFDQQLSVQEMLDAIALRGRGTISMGSGQLEVVWDAPDQAAVGVFSMSNILRDSFEIEYSTEELADEVVAAFVNKDADYQRDVVRVLEPGTTTPLRSRGIELFGCDNATEAAQSANLYIAGNLYRARRYRWRMDWEAMPLSRGEVGYLSHDLASFDYSGRLIEGSTDAVLKLERAVPLDPGGSFITIVKPDQTFATYEVQAGSGDSDEVTLTTPLAFDPGADPDHPPYDYRFLYGATATPGRKVKIESLKPVSYNTVEVTALDESVEYYEAADGDFTHTPPQSFGEAPQVSNLQLTYDAVRAAGGYQVEITATWDAAKNFSYADVRVSVNGAAQQLRAQEVRGRSATFLVPDFSDVAVELTAYGSLGRLGRFTKLTASASVNYAALFPPSTPSWFSVDGNLLSWGRVDDLDLAGYRLKYHYGVNYSWGDAIPLHEGLVTDTPYDMKARPPGVVTLMLRAVDTAGLESESTRSIVFDLGDPIIANIVETIDYGALDYPGTLGGATRDPAHQRVIASDATLSMWSPNESSAMWGAATDLIWSGEVFRAVAYIFRLQPSRAGAGSKATLDWTIAGAWYEVWYRRVGQAAMWGISGALPMWENDLVAMWTEEPSIASTPARLYMWASSDWVSESRPDWLLTDGLFATAQLEPPTGRGGRWSINDPLMLTAFNDDPLMWGGVSELMWTLTIGGFQPWPGALNIGNEPVDVYIGIGFGSTQGILSRLVATVDMPDIIERLNDVVLEAGGTRLPITATYREIVNVSATLQDDGNGANRVQIVDKDAELGPLIAADNSGVASAALIDAVVQGY